MCGLKNQHKGDRIPKIHSWSSTTEYVKPNKVKWVSIALKQMYIFFLRMYVSIEIDHEGGGRP